MVKSRPANAEDIGDSSSVPGSGGSPGGGNGSPLQDSCLENPHGQRSLAVYSPWSRKELDMTKQQNTFTYQVRSANSKTKEGQLVGQHARRVQHSPISNRITWTYAI